MWRAGEWNGRGAGEEKQGKEWGEVSFLPPGDRARAVDATAAGRAHPVAPFQAAVQERARPLPMQPARPLDAWRGVRPSLPPFSIHPSLSLSLSLSIPLTHLDQLLVGFDPFNNLHAQRLLLDARHELADDGQGDLTKEKERV